MSYINSKEYWDNRFDTNWIAFNGIKQTTAFMKLLVNNLPSTVQLNGLSILDWGCALGQGVNQLTKSFPASEVSGLDFSESAIKKCLDTYPMNDFYCGRLSDFSTNYDVIITSNCLEHFEDPFTWLGEIIEHSNKYVIVLVPHNDDSYLNKDSEHKCKFTEDSFSDEIDGFTKVYQKVITECPDCWAGEQLLVIYEKV